MDTLHAGDYFLRLQLDFFSEALAFAFQRLSRGFFPFATDWISFLVTSRCSRLPFTAKPSKVLLGFISVFNIFVRPVDVPF